MSKPPLPNLARLALLVGILLAAAAGVRAKGAPGRATVPDVDTADFEDGTQPFFLVTENGQPPAASLFVTNDPQKIHDGLFALEYAYERMSDPIPILVHPALLADLDSLEYWIKAERDTFWVTFHVDRDGAQFDAVTYLPAGLWTFVDLGPLDFFIDPNSPAQKPRMEPECNGFYWYGLDLFGEAIAFDTGSIRILDGTCDGTGGYLGCRDQGEMLLIRSDALCETVCDGSSRLGIVQGTVQGPVTAAEDAVIGLKQCTILGKLIELGNGKIHVR